MADQAIINEFLDAAGVVSSGGAARIEAVWGGGACSRRHANLSV